MASHEPPVAAAAADAEQPSAAPKEPEKAMTTVPDPEAITSSPDQVHLHRDGSKDPSGPRVFRLVFQGKTVFEYRSHGSCSASQAPCSSTSISLRSSSGVHCPHPHPHPHPPPVVPDWVMARASRCREEREGGDGPAVDVRFLMTKKLTKTDLNIDENRLLVPAAFVNCNIVPLLRDDEKKAASLGEYSNKKRRRPEEPHSAPETQPPEVEKEGGELPPKKRWKSMEKGRQHGGLQVTGWTRNGWHLEGLRLTCWDRNNATVLKGEHLKFLYDRSFVREGDQVELWGFRDLRGQLQLALHKSSSSSSSSSSR